MSVNDKKVRLLWDDMANQRWNKLEGYFSSEAVIDWPNTNERFTPNGYMRANSEYPGRWDIDVVRTEECGGTVISVVKITLHDGDVSFYATSFFTFGDDGRIVRLTEYFGDNAPAPEWRQAMGIAKPIITE